MKIEIGDLVQCQGSFNNKVGLVIGTEENWWCLKDHYDVASCIIHKDNVKLIKKNVVPKQYKKYLM